MTESMIPPNLLWPFIALIEKSVTHLFFRRVRQRRHPRRHRRLRPPDRRLRRFRTDRLASICHQDQPKHMKYMYIWLLYYTTFNTQSQTNFNPKKFNDNLKKIEKKLPGLVDGYRLQLTWPFSWPFWPTFHWRMGLGRLRILQVKLWLCSRSSPPYPPKRSSQWRLQKTTRLNNKNGEISV